MSKSCIFRVQIWKQNQLCKNMRKARKIPHYRLKNLWVLGSILVNLQREFNDNSYKPLPVGVFQYPSEI